MYWEKKERQECPVKCTSWYWVTSQSSQHHGRTPEKEIEICSQINKSYFGKAQFRPWCIFSKLTDVFDKFVTQKDSLCSLCLISTKLSKLNQSWEEKKNGYVGNSSNDNRLASSLQGQMTYTTWIYICSEKVSIGRTRNYDNKIGWFNTWCINLHRIHSLN